MFDNQFKWIAESKLFSFILFYFVVDDWNVYMFFNIKWYFLTRYVSVLAENKCQQYALLHFTWQYNIAWYIVTRPISIP